VGLCHTLRHDGIDYGAYIERITYLLFLKMADERGVEVPKNCDWPSIRTKSGTDLTDDYVEVLRKLGKTPGIVGDIYSGAQSRFNNPVNLKKLVSLTYGRRQGVECRPHVSSRTLHARATKAGSARSRRRVGVPPR